jgi:hypothetical protein
MNDPTPSIVTLCSDPGPLFSVAAFGNADFEAILARVGATPVRREVTSFGKAIDAYRSLFLELPGRRFAVITKYDSQADFEMGLQRDGWKFEQAELEAIVDFLGIAIDGVERYCNPPVEWVEGPASHRVG